MSSRWRAGLPPALRREDPATLLGLLAIVELADGISQANLQRKVLINQSRLSKLLSKLIKADLLDETSDYYDRRTQLLRSTESGTGLLRFLESGPSLSDIELLAAGNVELLP